MDTSKNPDVRMTQAEAVDEVLGILTGLDLAYDPSEDRFNAVTRAINRALRNNALEHEWSYYSDVEELGYAHYGHRTMPLRNTLRARLISDDALRLQDEDGNIKLWAYSLPRDSLSKYAYREGLWYSTTRSTVEFSRPFTRGEHGLKVMLPVMREPRTFPLPRAATVDYGGGDSGPFEPM